MKIDTHCREHQTLSLKARLIMLLTWMILPFIIFSVFKAVDIHKSLEKEAQTESLNLSRSISQSIDDYIGATGDLLISIANHKDVRERNYAAINEWFKEIGPDYPFYVNIIFVDRKGDIKAFVKQTKASRGGVVNVSDTVYYQRAMSSFDVSVGDFMYSKLTGLPVVHVTHPVFDTTGERVGFVAASFNLTKIQHKLVTSNISQQSVVTVVDDKGIVIARSADPQEWVGADISKKPVFRSMKGRIEGRDKTVGIDGTTRLIGFAATTRVPWHVIVGVDNAYIYAQLKESLTYHFSVFIPLLLVAIFGWLWIGRDMNRLHARTEYLTLIDPLTELFNYRKLSSDLDFELQRSSRSKGSLAFAMVDIDHFKNYNDLNGHQVGDDALRQIARIMSETVRGTDTVYRCGGEEFSVLMRDTDRDGAMAVMERVRVAVSEAHFESEENQPLGDFTISIGVAAYPVDSICKDGLIKSADTALYKAKSTGRNMVEACCSRSEIPLRETISHHGHCI